MTIRKKEIYSPACYIPLIKMAKKIGPTYNVKYVDQTFFYSSIRPGRTHGDAKVDISQLQYTTDGVFHKLEHIDTYWRLPPQRLKDVHINLGMIKLQNTPQPKTMRKWKDLQSLILVIISVSLNHLFHFSTQFIVVLYLFAACESCYYPVETSPGCPGTVRAIYYSLLKVDMSSVWHSN